MVLVHSHSHATARLMAHEAEAWNSWPATGGSEDSMARLAELGLAHRGEGAIDPLPPIAADPHVFRLGGRTVRWYRETPDLTLVFNADGIRRDSLSALGPYGTLVWNGALEGKTVRETREEAMRVFGVDEVEPFLLRLRELGLVRCAENPTLHRMDAERVVKDFPVSEIQFEVIQSKVPWYCLWELCTTCNLRCSTCYQEDYIHRGPTTEEAMAIARDLVGSGVFYVALLGGEPLVRKDLVPLVRTLREGGVFTKVITNGTLLTPEIARELAEARLNQLEVSFDGIRPETHDASRGEGTFQKAVDGLRNARAAGIPRQSVVNVLRSDNVGDFEGLPSFLDGVGVHECCVWFVKTTAHDGTRTPWTPPTQQDRERIQGLITQWRESHPHLSVDLLPDCNHARTCAVIGTDGAIRLCPFHNVSKGNVLESSILDVWQSFEENLPESGPPGSRTVKPCGAKDAVTTRSGPPGCHL
jgi:MoaA/NifB/PqqE/SkfB family radical SAM enzyme